MMNPDEDLPKPVRKLLVPPILDMLAVAELRDYISALEAEILRVNEAISKKNAAREAAASFFKTKPA